MSSPKIAGPKRSSLRHGQVRYELVRGFREQNSMEALKERCLSCCRVSRVLVRMVGMVGSEAGVTSVEVRFGVPAHGALPPAEGLRAGRDAVHAELRSSALGCAFASTMTTVRPLAFRINRSTRVFLPIKRFHRG
jgi:hypothetical protein